MRHTPLLASHTVETALQELAALVLASGLIARLRVQAADRAQLPPTRVSFFKLMIETEELWATLRHVGPELTQAQYARLLERYYAAVERSALLPERGPRTCPRVVRQPVTSWPRKTTQRSSTGDITIEVTCA